MNNWYCMILSGEFEDEEFFVRCDYRKDAIKIAEDIANGEMVFVGCIPWTDEDAEKEGFDTY